MKRFLTIVFALCFSQQVLAVTTVAGIDFIAIADTLNNPVGSFISNSANGTGSIVDGNGASYILSADNPASVDVFFSGDLFNVSQVDLTILFVGRGGHFGTATLLGGSAAGNTAGFNIADGENYTGHDAKSEDGTTMYGNIFYATLDLSGFSGTFSGVSLDLSSASAVPSLVGTTAPAAPVAAVPVPAAAGLFASGLLGLLGIARKKA